MMRKSTNSSAYSSMRRLATVAVAAAIGSREITGCAAAAEDSQPSLVVERRESTAVLLAVRDGPAGEAALREWSDYAGSSLPGTQTVHVLCSSECSVVDNFPHVLPFFASGEESWGDLLGDFLAANEDAGVVGLLGQGVLPHPDLARAIESMHSALAGSDTPTAVLTRSQGRRGSAIEEGSTGEDSVEGNWLSDRFLSQLWLNRALLESCASSSQRQSEHRAGLGEVAVENLTLLALLPRLLRDDPSARLVDGTNILRSAFDVGGEGVEILAAAAAVGGAGDNVYIGTLELALVDAGAGDGSADIATAPWPPAYTLEHVADEDGLVIVNNVNCGYLDFATNFLRSVERVSDAKVLWVAMDDVAFDFMDALAPGCASMFPSEGSERHHAIAAGVMGDATFQAEVLVRPSILQSVLAQGYTVLWTDSDVVWLGNPLPLLPDINDPSSAEVMLQHDGNAGNKCTCFMYLQPTDIAKELLVLWKQSILDSNAFEDQLAFRPALVHQQDAGMRLDIISHDVFPAGKDFFDHEYEENYHQIHHEKALVVHNNWIKGHDAKLARFREYHFWDVEHVFFPSCSA